MENRETPYKSFSSLLYHYLGMAEKGILVMTAVGILLVYSDIERTYVLTISMVSLAMIFFLSAYKPIQIERSEDEKFGFRELLAYTIAPKILWLGSSVTVLGMLFLFMDLPNKVDFQMMSIGGVAIAAGIVVLAFAAWTQVKHIGVVAPVLYRAVPVLLIDIYLLYAILEFRTLFG